MVHQLKAITRDSIPRALSLAERYRLLNEPREAESICRDILAADPGSQDAMICLILAQTDLFTQRQGRVNEARAMAGQLRDEYARAYYRGVIEERWAKSLLDQHHAVEAVYASLREAMMLFESAEALAPAGNDDAVLRWNTCVRLLERLNHTPAEGPSLDDTIDDADVPIR